MAASVPKYPNSLENITNREYKIFSIALDIAINIGKLSVAKGNSKEKITEMNTRLIKILDESLAKHTTRKIKRGRPNAVLD